MSNQIDDISAGSASPASEDKKRRRSADGPITGPMVKVPLAVPPSGVAQLFNDPPLVGDEKREDYEKLFLAIAAAVKPADVMAWIFTWEVACLSWEIKRERVVKANIIRSAQIDAVRDSLEATETGKLSSLLDSGKNDRAARQWASNSKSRREIDTKLTDAGYGPSDILAHAYVLGARNIDAIDRRLASYEVRRMAVLREVEARNERFARKLGAASARIIDAEVTDAS
jgi:hypothetical protein